MPLFFNKISIYWRSFFSNLFQYALPNICTLCGHVSQKTLCNQCEKDYWEKPQCLFRCIQCANPLSHLSQNAPENSAQDVLLSTTKKCGRCLSKPPQFDATLALTDYITPLNALALKLKFNGELNLAIDFASRLARAIKNTEKAQAEKAQVEKTMPHFADRPDFIMPVPLTLKRLAERGYNQAWEIARPLSSKLKIVAKSHFLIRQMDTPSQIKLSAKERQKNLRNAFAIKPNVNVEILRNKHIAIVDDVMTSGATLNEIARLLKKNGAARVTNWVVFRTSL